MFLKTAVLATSLLVGTSALAEPFEVNAAFMVYGSPEYVDFKTEQDRNRLQLSCDKERNRISERFSNRRSSAKYVRYLIRWEHRCNNGDDTESRHAHRSR